MIAYGSFLDSIMLRWVICGLCCFLLQACGGDATTASEQNQPPVLGSPDNLPVNTRVSCGGWQWQLPFSLPASLPQSPNWVIMGSSSAFGAGASSYQNSWAGLLAADDLTKQANVINIARGGYTSYHALSDSCVVSPDRPKADNAHNIDRALALNADVVLLSFPSNDAASLFSAAETAANLLLIRWQLANANIPVVILSAQPRTMSADRQRLLVALDAWLKPLLGPCFVELYPLLLGDSGKLASQFDSGDGVHLTDAGHKVVFDALKSTLLNERCVRIP